MLLEYGGKLGRVGPDGLGVVTIAHTASRMSVEARPSIRRPTAIAIDSLRNL